MSLITMIQIENSLSDLIKKYNVPGPRYTSYPTVPFWDLESFSTKLWKKKVHESFLNYGIEEGISLYIHLPYCESLCTYCGCTTRITVNHCVEVPYIEAVLQEWEMYKKILGHNPRIKEIHLGGGTPTFFSPENLFFLMEGILGNTPITDEVEFGFEGHPVNTTKEHLKVLYDFGFRRVSYGIQDFDEEVQRIVNRKQTFEQVEYVTNMAREIGYTSINFDLIYGLPKQTLSGMIETIKKVNLLKPDRIAFYSYAHVPWIKPGQRKFTELDLPADDAKRQLYETGRTLFEAAGYTEIGMDHFALRSDALSVSAKNKTLHRNFMGYTSSKTSMLLGLGCSSISDTWTGFAQNVKTVEEYITEVKNGNLPVFKGHILTNEDMVLRKHILNIICKLKTSWDEETLQCAALAKCIDRLNELQEDGLVVVESTGLYVTDVGKPFIRNICMAFDERMQQRSANESIFSKVI